MIKKMPICPIIRARQKSSRKLFSELINSIEIQDNCIIQMMIKNFRFAFSEALRGKDYPIRPLTNQDKASALKFAQQQFFESEPTEVAFYKLFSQQKSKSHLYWERVNRLFGDELFARGLSFGYFDQEKGSIAGAILSKDYGFNPIQERYPEKGTFLYGVRKLREKMLVQVAPQYYSLVNGYNGDGARMIEMWFAAVHPQQRNKGLLRKMMTKLEQVGAMKSYHYIFSWATNIGTAACYKRLGYQKISEVDVKDFAVDGVRYFRELEELQRYQSFWIKPLPRFGEMNMEDDA